MREAHLTRFEQANLIAGHAVSYATAYLDGRHDAAKLGDNADRLFLDMLVIETEETSTFLIPVQLLAIAMMRAAKNARELKLDPDSYTAIIRSERWDQVMASLVELVCQESGLLKRTDA